MPRPARFFVLDGVDGCGKTTQAARLVESLTVPERPEPLHLREPGSTSAGERIRDLLLARDVEIGVAAEALLFAAARRQTLDELVAPALARGVDVVCERFHASTFAYQGVAGGLGEERVLALLREFAGEPAPDREFLLLMETELALHRRGPAGDRIEDRGAEFAQRVARGYERYVELEPRAVRIDATGTEDEVAARILEEVSRAG